MFVMFTVTIFLFQLKPVEFLLGSSSKLGEIIVLGMLTQLKEVRHHAIDISSKVSLVSVRNNTGDTFNKEPIVTILFK